MAGFDQELIDNYRTLAESRGWSLSQMAENVEGGHAALAAELRSLDAGEKKPAKRSEAPKGRRAAGPKDEA